MEYENPVMVRQHVHYDAKTLKPNLGVASRRPSTAATGSQITKDSSSRCMHATFAKSISSPSLFQLVSVLEILEQQNLCRNLSGRTR